MSVFPDVIYEHAKQLAAERSDRPAEEVDLLLAAIQLHVQTRRLLARPDLDEGLPIRLSPQRTEPRSHHVPVSFVSSNAA